MMMMSMNIAKKKNGLIVATVTAVIVLAVMIPVIVNKIQIRDAVWLTLMNQRQKSS
jgi:hypothetical protein